MPLRLPRWNLGEPAFEVRDGSSREIRGRLSVAFKTWLDLSYSKLEEQEDRQDRIDSELQDAVAVLEVTVDAVEALANDNATLTGQMNSLLTYYVPLVDGLAIQVADLTARVEALEGA